MEAGPSAPRVSDLVSVNVGCALARNVACKPATYTGISKMMSREADGPASNFGRLLFPDGENLLIGQEFFH